ncbi:MAG: beta-N-acetylglucosaminidase domain-containing protein [Selenomonadaceae bacterium]|nr:beta-N-acetylglucosaminidase domain-containing protein [Selenomonadaceae bacterium]
MFCGGEQGLNAYIYAPKNDPYHKDRWREPYPKKEQKKLKELVQTPGKWQIGC